MSQLTGRLVLALTLALTLFAIPVPAAAQAVTGTLLGNVTDASGASVPGVSVTATEVATNISRTTVSNEAGAYIFPSLVNGKYTVVAELQGFKRVVHENVKVDVNTTIRVDVALLDKLMTRVGELVLTRNQILQRTNSLNDAEFVSTAQRHPHRHRPPVRAHGVIIDSSVN